MIPLFLTDAESKDKLFPFTLTRSAADIRVGILTIRQKWETCLGQPIRIAEDQHPLPDKALILSANIIPSAAFMRSFAAGQAESTNHPAWDDVKIMQYPWHIFQWNDWALREDFVLVTANRKSAPIPPTVQAARPENIFIEAGAKLSACIVNAETGPVYIGKNAEVMEGAVIRGPFALCEGAVVKMGAQIYGATTIGPYSVVGGEIKNSVVFGYSNKSHGGYLGDSVIGEWCNLGAGTSNSNMKNNAGNIRLWNNVSREMMDAGITKCGLIMGDYSRAAINTSFNTGTIVGVCANVFGEGLTPSFIPSFSWGTRAMARYQFDKAMEHIGNWKKLKHAQLHEQERTRLRLIFDQN